MDANGVFDKLDADIYKLDEASKVVMLRHLLPSSERRPGICK